MQRPGPNTWKAMTTTTKHSYRVGTGHAIVSLGPDLNAARAVRDSAYPGQPITLYSTTTTIEPVEEDHLPVEFTTPSGVFTVTARHWPAEQRPQVLTEIAELIASLLQAFPELASTPTATPPAGTITYSRGAKVSDPVPYNAPTADIVAAELSVHE